MSDEDFNVQFRAIADTFIEVANQHAEKVPVENVGMAMLYAASRFNAFVVSSKCEDLEKYEGDLPKAIDFFLDNYKTMLEENLEDYKRTYDPDFKYAHLMKSSNN
jgi:hypothetical protein